MDCIRHYSRCQIRSNSGDFRSQCSAVHCRVLSWFSCLLDHSLNSICSQSSLFSSPCLHSSLMHWHYLAMLPQIQPTIFPKSLYLLGISSRPSLVKKHMKHLMNSSNRFHNLAALRAPIDAGTRKLNPTRARRTFPKGLISLQQRLGISGLCKNCLRLSTSQAPLPMAMLRVPLIPLS